MSKPINANKSEALLNKYKAYMNGENVFNGEAFVLEEISLERIKEQLGINQAIKAHFKQA